MSHIECVKNNGVPYLRIAESRYFKDIGRQKKFVIKNLGPLSKFDDGNPDFLIRFREQFKNGELDFDGISYTNKILPKYSYEFDFDESNPLSYSILFQNIGYKFLESVYEDLGINDAISSIKSRSKITYDLNGLTKLLVFNRILNPSSKKQCFETKQNYWGEITTSKDIKEIYRALDVLDKKSKSIQLRMNTKIKNSSIERKTDLTYYDVTNYYFETMYGDDDTYELDENHEIKLNKDGKPIVKEKGFRKKGVSKENRKEPIVQMGLFIDNNGLPVSYKLFPGNTQDKTTFKNVLENDVKDMDLGRIVVVADNGMNTQENKYIITEQKNGYIVSKSVKKSWTKLRDWVMSEERYTSTNNSLGETTFKYKSRINEVKLTYTNDDGTRTSKIVKEKEIIYWSKKHYEREVFQSKKFIEYLESCKTNPDKLKDKQRKSQEFIKIVDVDKKTGEVINPDKLVVFLDDKLEKYKETMGYYSIVTSEIEADDQEIINKYHGLSRIEDSFRIIKSDLEGRPIHVWTKEHINAHFLICFIALTIIRVIQYKMLKNEKKNTSNVDGWEQGITAERMKNNLSKYQCSIDKNGMCIFSGLTQNILDLYKYLGVKYQLKAPTITELNKLLTSIKYSNIM